MGFIYDVFSEIFGSEPAENGGEEDARRDHDRERNSTNRDPIPTEPPDWAKDLPNPRDY